MQVEQFFAEGECLPGQEEPVEEAKMYPIQFEVPKEIIEKARQRQDKSEIFEKVNIQDLEFLKTLDMKNNDDKASTKMRDAIGNSILHVAAKKQSLDMVRYIVETLQLDVNSTVCSRLRNILRFII